MRLSVLSWLLLAAACDEPSGDEAPKASASAEVASCERLRTRLFACAQTAAQGEGHPEPAIPEPFDLKCRQKADHVVWLGRTIEERELRRCLAQKDCNAMNACLGEIQASGELTPEASASALAGKCYPFAGRDPEPCRKLCALLVRQPDVSRFDGCWSRVRQIDDAHQGAVIKELKRSESNRRELPSAVTMPAATRKELLDTAERSCGMKTRAGCRRLGDLLLGADGDRAAEAYRRGCLLLEEQARKSCLAKAEERVKEAGKLRQSCDGGSGSDCLQLGNLVAHGHTSHGLFPFAGDIPRAVELWRKGCELDLPASTVERCVVDRLWDAAREPHSEPQVWGRDDSSQ